MILAQADKVREMRKRVVRKRGQVPRPRLAPWDRGSHWIEEVNQPLSLASLDSMRQSVARGTPQGRPQWITDLTTAHGLESTVRPRGRPRNPISGSTAKTVE